MGVPCEDSSWLEPEDVPQARLYSAPVQELSADSAALGFRVPQANR
jgi:hypothetical protein